MLIRDIGTRESLFYDDNMARYGNGKSLIREILRKLYLRQRRSSRTYGIALFFAVSCRKIVVKTKNPQQDGSNELVNFGNQISQH